MSQVTSGLEEKDISPTNSRKSTEKNAADADDKGSETEKLSSKKEQAAKERPDWTDALHMLHTLNDCTWCTNLFVKERERESHTQNIGLCVNKQKDFYSLSDVRKELKYIELILDRLKESILTLADKKYRSKEYCLIKDTVDGSWPKNIVDDGEKIADSDCTGEKPLDGRIGRKRKGKDSANNGYDEGFELRVIRAKEYDLKCDGDFEIAGLGNDVNTTYLFRNIGDNVAAVVGECRSIKSMTLDALREIDWREDLRAKQRRVNEKIGMMNDLLGIVSSDDELKEDVKSVREFFARKRTEVPKELRLTKDPSESCHPCHSCNPSRVADVDALLFDKEKWRIDVVRRNGGDPLEHLEGIALPIDYDSFKSDTRATYYGIKRKNLLGISLQTADMTEQFRKNRTSVTFHFLMLLLEISLYLTDTVSDLILALDHFFNGNKIYAYLTIAFVLAPILAEMLSKFILKVLGWDKEYGRFTWKDVFNFNDFRISMRMKDSVVYTLNSMKDYGMVAATYGDLHSYRCRKGKTEYKIKTVAVEMDDSIHIQKVFYAMFKWNERFVLQTLLAESLNESAPQLLLQLTIVIKQYYGAEKIGVMSWISIVTSVLSLSYVMQLSHYNRHYHTGGRILNNSFKIKARLLEFLGNCFVHGARITAICLVTFVFEAWFIFGAFVYLIAIYFVMITCSGRKEIYRTLHRYKTTIFWPLHRLFTIPYRIGIWRMDSLDHLLFYLEIVCLALSLPFLLPVHDKENLAWIVSAAILSCEVIGVVILCVFKKFFHPYGYVCKNR